MRCLTICCIIPNHAHTLSLFVLPFTFHQIIKGEACGLVKNLALLAHITTDMESGPIERLCRDLGVEDVTLLSGNEIHSRNAYCILLNGLILGVHLRPIWLVKSLRTLRRQGQV